MATATPTIHPAQRAALESAAARQEVKRKAAEDKAAADKAIRDAAQAAQAEQKRENAARALCNQVRDFVNGFMEAVGKHADKAEWSPTAVEQAFTYANQLIAQDDNPDCPLDPSMRRAVNDRFLYGIVLNEYYGNPVPDDTFWGQRQDWFIEQLEQKRKQFKANKPNHRS